MYSIWDRSLEETAVIYRDVWEVTSWLQKIR